MKIPCLALQLSPVETATQLLYINVTVGSVYAGQRHVASLCGPHFLIQAATEPMISVVPSRITGFSTLLGTHLC